ncbi:MAG: aldehyde dehydrogenase [Dehalococcoidales bacterium]|nr:aldehyde dehydrogenase [Dehalococcoidales bacterium]
MKENKLWIGGQFVDTDSGQTFATHNPTTGEEISRIPLAGKSDVDKAVAAARKAYPAWSKKTQGERSAIVAKIAQAIRDNTGELARLEVLEHGTPVTGAPHMVGFAAALIDFAASASRALMGEVIPAASNAVCYLKREPVGVCALITPWNVPSMMIASKLGPCLAAGNTCVIKPPSINSLIGLKFAEILDKLDLPSGVVNIITGPGETVGNTLAAHSGVDLVAFTGSCETGKAIMSAASQTIKRLALELGGKNPAIVLEDVDMNPAIEGLAHYAYINGGQNCASPSRFYVQEKIHDEFVEKFIAATKEIRMGDPADADTLLGPMASEGHRAKVESYIKAGIDEGAKLVLGGGRPGAPLDKGYYIEPTIFTGVTQNMKIAREEIFGPVISFFKYSSDEEVLEMANDSTFGLCASVWTRDVARGIRFVDDLQVGTVWVNQHMNLAPEFPWGGYKESGLGKESGMLGLAEYTQLKLVCLKY